MGSYPSEVNGKVLSDEFSNGRFKAEIPFSVVLWDIAEQGLDCALIVKAEHHVFAQGIIRGVLKTVDDIFCGTD